MVFLFRTQLHIWVPGCCECRSSCTGLAAQPRGSPRLARISHPQRMRRYDRKPLSVGYLHCLNHTVSAATRAPRPEVFENAVIARRNAELGGNSRKGTNQKTLRVIRFPRRGRTPIAAGEAQRNPCQWSRQTESTLKESNGRKAAARLVRQVLFHAVVFATKEHPRRISIRGPPSVEGSQ